MKNIRMEPYIKLPKVNEKIEFYQGKAFIEEYKKEIDCIVYIDWFPNIALYFSFQVDSDISNNEITICINDNKYDVKLISNSSVVGGNSKYRGILKTDDICFDNNKEINFLLVNFNDYLGDLLFGNVNSNSWSRDRLLIENDDFILKIDKRIDHIELFKELKKTGGYCMTL